MADPTVSLVTSGTSATASTQISFTSVAAGTLLVLTVAADDYKTGDPSGWTLSTGCAQQGYAGHYLWWKIASGSETSVTYVIGSATVSTYHLLSATNIEGTGSLDISNGQSQQLPDVTAYATPSVTTSSGRRLAVASLCAMNASQTSTMASWTNSYTERGDTCTTSGSFDNLGSATLVLDGGGSTSTQSTVSYGSLWQGGIIAVFKVAAESGVTATAVSATSTVQNYATAGVDIVIGGTSRQGIWT